MVSLPLVLQVLKTVEHWGPALTLFRLLMEAAELIAEGNVILALVFLIFLEIGFVLMSFDLSEGVCPQRPVLESIHEKLACHSSIDSKL